MFISKKIKSKKYKMINDVAAPFFNVVPSWTYVLIRLSSCLATRIP